MHGQRLDVPGVGDTQRAERSARRSTTDLLTRKKTHFVLWRPRGSAPPPRLVIGRVVPGAPARFEQLADVPLLPSTDASEVWELPAAALGLADGVYHYWFLVKDDDPYGDRNLLLHRTDPHAFVVDWRTLRDGVAYPQESSG